MEQLPWDASYRDAFAQSFVLYFCLWAYSVYEGGLEEFEMMVSGKTDVGAGMKDFDEWINDRRVNGEDFRIDKIFEVRLFGS